MRVLWLILLFAACTPTYIVLGGTADGGEEASLVVDAARIDAVASDVPVALDVQVSVDVPVRSDIPMLDRPQVQDVPAARDVVLVPVDSGVEPTGPRGIRPGALIKGSNPAIFYYARDGRRYLFPNEYTYYSWYQDQQGVVSLRDDELASINLGGNVTVRPGTWLVKITTDPRLYAVSRCGTLHWIESEQLGVELFGANWNTGSSGVVPGPGVRRSRDIPETLFANYRIGASIRGLRHPDGSLIRYTGSVERYLVQDGQRRRISPDAFRANRLYDSFVILTTVVYPDGAPITGYEPLLSDPVCLP